jgi:hypothetical protein
MRSKVVPLISALGNTPPTLGLMQEGAEQDHDFQEHEQVHVRDLFTFWQHLSFVAIITPVLQVKICE